MGIRKGQLPADNGGLRMKNADLSFPVALLILAAIKPVINLA